MKAHIATLPPATALVWNAPEVGALEKVCAGAGLRLRRVEQQDLGRTVGALCGLPGAGDEAVPAAAADPTPALVLWGLDRKELDAFLGQLKEAGVRIPLKAVVTDTNRAWTFAALLEELHAEHRAMQNGGK